MRRERRLGRSQQARPIICQGLQDDSSLRIDEAVEALAAIGAKSDAVAVLCKVAADGSRRASWKIVTGADVLERLGHREEAIELIQCVDERSYEGDLAAAFLLERLDRPVDGLRVLSQGLEIRTRFANGGPRKARADRVGSSPRPVHIGGYAELGSGANRRQCRPDPIGSPYW